MYNVNGDKCTSEEDVRREVAAVSALTMTISGRDPACVSLAEVLALLGEVLPDGADGTSGRFAVKRLQRRQSLQRAGERFKALYIVQSGVLMTSSSDAHGIEQVLSFPMRGDAIGLDGIGQDKVATDVMALDVSRVVAVPFVQLSDLSRGNSHLQRVVHRLFGRELSRDREMLRVLGSFSAEARVANFLLDLSQRYARLGGSSDVFVFPMRRQDMARYLGLQLETVSRAMTSLTSLGLVEVDGRRVAIRDVCALRRLSQRSTRQCTRPH